MADHTQILLSPVFHYNQLTSPQEARSSDLILEPYVLVEYVFWI